MTANRMLVIVLSALISTAAPAGGVMGTEQDGSKSNATVPAGIQFEPQSPRHGSWYSDDGQVNWVYFRVRVFSQTNTDVTIPLKSWQLELDGQRLTAQSAGPDILENVGPFLPDEDQIRPEQFRSLILKPAGTGDVQLIFRGLPEWDSPPHMKLHCVTDSGIQVSVDINDWFQQRLQVSTERIGPGKILALVQVSGDLNCISAGKLTSELDRLTGQKVTRVVTFWPDGAKTPTEEGLSWLQDVASQSGYSDESYDDTFPPVPPGISDFHVVLPQEKSGEPSLPTENAISPNAEEGGDHWLPRNSHRTLPEAVSAAIRTVCDQMSRDAVLGELESGHLLTRPAVLEHAGDKLLEQDLPVVLRLVSHERPELRRAALIALRHFDQPEAVSTLTGLAQSDDRTMAQGAIESLVLSRFASVRSELPRLLTLNHSTLTERVIDTISRHPRPEFAGTLKTALQHPNRSVRQAALRGLSLTGHPEILTILREALAGSDEGMRHIALELLARRTDPESERLASEWVLRSLEDGPPGTAVLGLIRRTQDTRAVPLLKRYAADSRTRSQGIIATLVAIGDDSVLADVSAKFTELSSFEKRSVLRTLLELRSPRFSELVEPLLASPGSDDFEMAVSLLGSEGSPQSVERLVQAAGRCRTGEQLDPVAEALFIAGTQEARSALQSSYRSAKGESRNVLKRHLQALYLRSPAMESYRIALSLSANERQNEALRVINQAIELDPDLPDARRSRSSMILRREKLTPELLAIARQDFEKLHELGLNAAEGTTGLGLVLVREGRILEGIALGEQQRTRLEEPDPLFFYNMACIYGRAIAAGEQQSSPSEDQQKQIADWTQQGLKDLRSSLEAGLDDYNREWMKRDPDLRPFHTRPEFNALFE